jgi:hypothetical protein
VLWHEPALGLTGWGKEARLNPVGLPRQPVSLLYGCSRPEVQLFLMRLSGLPGAAARRTSDSNYNIIISSINRLGKHFLDFLKKAKKGQFSPNPFDGKSSESRQQDHVSMITKIGGNRTGR